MKHLQIASAIARTLHIVIYSPVHPVHMSAPNARPPAGRRAIHSRASGAVSTRVRGLESLINPSALGRLLVIQSM